MKLLLAGMAALGFAAALSIPASAAPGAGAALSRATMPALQTVQWRRDGQRNEYAPPARGPAPRYGGGSGDNVGSIGYDGSPYGYNRFSGQRYQTCMMDEGYGRVRPCSEGGRP